MSGFVATATSSTATGEADVIHNDGWFPQLSLSGLREQARIDGTVTDARLREAARYAVCSINLQLHEFKVRHLSDDVASLGAVSADEIDGEPRLVMLYRRAVTSTVNADLMERYRDLDSTDSGLRRAVDLDPAIGDHRRNASWAVRDILGRTRTVVELI
jgi:hypothetical protein